MKIPLPLRLLARTLGAVIAITLALLAAPAKALAQNPPKPPAQLRFLFIDESPGAYSLKVGRDLHVISSSPYAISSPFSPPDRGPFDIYKKPLRPDPVTGLLDPVKIGSISPPTGASAALAIITPRPPAPGSTLPSGLDIEFINNDPSAFPEGSLRIIHRGHATMAAQLGTETITVERGATRLHRPTTDARHRVIARVAAQSPEGWQFISDTILVIRPRQRVTALFFHSPSGMRHFYTAEELNDMSGPPPPTHVWLTYTDSL